MFNFSGSEIVFLLLIALVVLGPEKLPEAIRKFGKTYGEFKKMTSGFQSELKSALDEPMREIRETADAFKKAASFEFDTGANSADTKDEIASAAGPEAAVDVDTRPSTPTPAAPAPTDDPGVIVDAPAPTGLDALVIRDAPVQQAKPAPVEPPPIANPVVTRAPRKNTAASFRRAPKPDVDSDSDADPVADSDADAARPVDGSAPPLAPSPVDGDDGSAPA